MSLLDNLKTMNREELVRFADTQGVKVHWNAKPETIIQSIISKVTSPTQDMHKPAPQVINGVEVEQPKMTQLMAQKLKAAEEAKSNTPEKIEEAIAKIKARVPEFVSAYNRDENTWQFSCKGAVDSGNIAIPLKRIVQNAEIVSRGRLVMMGLNQHFDQLGVSGKNAYTNTVLA